LRKFNLKLSIDDFVYPNSGKGFFIPYKISGVYKTKVLPTSDAANLNIEFEDKYLKIPDELKLGETQDRTITLKNKRDSNLGMIMVILHIPSCMTINME
jgi:hypothetical protein